MADEAKPSIQPSSAMELQSVMDISQTNKENNSERKSGEINEEKLSTDIQYHQLLRDSKYSMDRPQPSEPQPNDAVIIQLADSNNKIVKYFKYHDAVKMRLDYGFRSIYEMYRFNKRPLIYVALSIASVYLPSVIFPKGGPGKLLFYMYLGFATVNSLIIVYCLGAALAAMIAGNNDQDTENQVYQHGNRYNNSSGNIFNPTDDPEDDDDSDVGLYIYDDCSDDDMRMPNTEKSPAIVRGDSDYSQGKSVRKISVPGDQKNVITKFFYRFGEQFNKLFDIRTVNSRIQSKIAPTFSGFLLVFSVLCCQILIAAITDEYEMGIFDICTDITYVNAATTSQDDLDNEIGTGECLGRKSAILNSNSMSAVTILIAFALFQEISSKAQERKLERRAKIKEECESHGVIRNIERKINNSVGKRILNQLTMKAMFKSIIWQTILCGSLLFYHGIAFGYYTSTNKDAAIWFSLFGNFNVLVNCVILLNSAQRFVTQYRYILCVMRQFSKPIYSKNIDDIIAWWQYRRYYREYEIKTFANIFHPMVSWLLLLTIIFVLYIAIVWIIWPEYELTADEHIMMVIITYFCFVVLYLCELAVRTHLEQRERNCGILDREVIHCKRNLSGKIDVSLIIDIRQEIWNNSKPILLVGIPMTRATIAGLRTYFATAVATLVADWYFGSN